MKNSKIAIYETDVQYDFSYRQGALFVHANKPRSTKPYGAEEKLPNIIAIHNHALANSWKILGSGDRHFYEDAELIRNRGGVFEDHCMNGTFGQLRIKELEPQKDIYVRAKDGPLMGMRKYKKEEIEKYIDSETQLIFEKQSYNVDTNPNFKKTFKMLLEKGLEKIIVDGFATDYCVKAAVLTMAKYKTEYKPELKIYVATDAIEEVDINFEGKIDMESGKKALEEMANAGAILIKTKEVLRNKL